MLLKNQIDHIRELLKEDWMQEDQMDFIICQIISLVSNCYDSHIKNGIKKDLIENH